MGELVSAERLFFEEGFCGMSKAKTVKTRAMLTSTGPGPGLPPYTITIGSGESGSVDDIDMTVPQNIWKTLDSSTEVNVENDRFLRCPVAFNFCLGHAQLLVVATHAHAGKKICNALEACFLQHLATQCVKKDRFMVLLGDFNSDEAGTQGMWDMSEALPIESQDADDDTEKAIEMLENVRRKFHESFVRVFHPACPTNVPS